ncbi:MAG: thioredoxin domain-containing protein, partial [Hyphomicrobiaceae bacterium]
MMRHPDRRLRGQAPITVFAGLLAFLAIGVVHLGDGARAQGSHSGHNPAPAAEVSDVDAAEVAKPGALPEIVLGKPDAPITIIEYASITCGHCGRFHRELLPEVKKKYIDTGIARLFVREFPLESVAAAAALLVRCSQPDVQYKFLEALFQRQQQWLGGNDVRNALIAIAKEFGLPETEFEGCLKDEALFKKVVGVRTRANEEFGVNSTPTFFINGKALVGP